MPTDIELADDTVRITDGTLEIEGNWGLHVGDGTRVRRDWIRTDRLLADDVHSDRIEVGEVEIGTASPSEPTAAGTTRVVDRHGADRIYLNGGEGSANQTDDRQESREERRSTKTLPWRSDQGWRTVRFPRERRINPPTLDLGKFLGEQDERDEAPESVRVYIEGDAGSIGLGGDGVDGDLIVTNGDGETVVHIDGDNGDITLEGLEKPVGETIRDLQVEIADLRGQL